MKFTCLTNLKLHLMPPELDYCFEHVTTTKVFRFGKPEKKFRVMYIVSGLLHSCTIDSCSIRS